MSGGQLQEALALGVVALVVILYAWRRLRRRAQSRRSCDGCDPPQTGEPRETVVRFYRRKN